MRWTQIEVWARKSSIMKVDNPMDDRPNSEISWKAMGFRKILTFEHVPVYSMKYRSLNIKGEWVPISWLCRRNWSFLQEFETPVMMDAWWRFDRNSITRNFDGEAE